MNLGTFSVSLAVKSLETSRTFYQKLGFEIFPAQEDWGDEFKATYDKTWVVLTSGEARIGLFQGMFDKNMLTFNPTDVRSIQKQLKAEGLELATEADESTEGPAHCFLMDPDGNPILIDQH